MGPCSRYAIFHKRATRQAGPETWRKPYARRWSHTYARYYVSQTGARRSYIRQERRALVATAVFHFALKPRAPRILLIRYIRKLIVIRWSRVYTREPPASPSRPLFLVHPPGSTRTALVHAYFPWHSYSSARRGALKPKLPLKRSRRIALKVSAINVNDGMVRERCMKFGSWRKNWEWSEMLSDLTILRRKAVSVSSWSSLFCFINISREKFNELAFNPPAFRRSKLID